MRATPRQSKILNKFQRDQLRLITPQLRKINAMAVLHLMRLHRFCDDPNVVSHVCTDLTELVRQGRFLMGWCETIRQNDLAPVEATVFVKVGVQCDACIDRQYSKRRDHNRSDHKPRIGNEAGWQQQIDWCLVLTSNVSAFVATSATLLNRSPRLIDCLNTFRKLLVRQYRFVHEITPDYAPKIEVIESDATHCQDCGASIPEVPSGH
jgi:hypothetical protein